MPIGDDDLSGAGVKRPTDGGVDISGHQLAEAQVFGMRGIDLVPGGDPGDAFHVSSDQKFHEFSFMESSGSSCP